jgi:kinesin family protein C1
MASAAPASSFAATAGAGAGAPAAGLEIRHEKGATTVAGLTVVPVTTPAEVHALVRVAMASRSTGATNSNSVSSRSHCVFTLRVTMEHKATAQRRSGVINLCDLAGSERIGKSGADGSEKLLKETQAINKSLSTLTQCLMAIKAGAPHVPFRSSKLTYLLQNSLGNDCTTLLIANLSPCFASAQESMCTLRFAKSIAEVGSTAAATGTAGSSSSSAAPGL